MQPRRRHAFFGWTAAASLVGLATAYAAAGPQVSAPAANEISIASDTCTSAKLGSEVPADRIGEPVRRVTLAAPTWTAATAYQPWLLPRRRCDRAGRYRHNGAADQLCCGAAGAVEPPRGAARRRRHERHHPEPDRRRRPWLAITACPRHRDLRQRLRTSGRIRSAAVVPEEHLEPAAKADRVARVGGRRRPAGWRGSCGSATCGRTRSGGRRLGTQRRSDRQSRLHADEEDA